MPEFRRLKLERNTINRMIHIYCRAKHSTKEMLCEDCEKLRKYAFERLLNCPYHENKPVCSNCTVHCYKPEMRQKVKIVMRYSGPKMILRHPYLAIMHLIYERRGKKILT